MMLFPKRSRTKPPRGRPGMALVLALALIVLMSAVVLAFFARATANRAVESSRVDRIMAGQVAQTALDYVSAQFHREITGNSVSFTNNNVVIHQPSANSFAVPQRPLPAALLTGANSTNFTNLIRLSVNETTGGIGETNASAHNTGSAARNGRSIGPGRWNAPAFLTGGGFTTTAQLPHWIYLNADGNVTATPGANAIGRFAYAVYDTSGLLDANVAGHRAGISGTNLHTLKGTLAGANLAAIPGVTDAAAFVAWRNAGSGATPASYVAAVTNAATNGFLLAASGDQRITSRQDIINLARNAAHGISTDALPFLTHFSRAVNAPSWTPPQNAPEMPDYFASLESSPRNYRTNAEDTGSVNRNVPNARVTTRFTRHDGTEALPGEPLIKQRFPLERLALVNPNLPTAAADLRKFFGLTWNAGADGWNYESPTIRTLHEVAAAGQEPNFFELLKAGILDGSLGKTSATDTGIQNRGPDRITDRQILAIGANLIDQADADDAPTLILRTNPAEDVFGIENHPYIYLISQTHFRRRDRDFNASPDPHNSQPWVTAYQQFQVWNSHLNAAPSGRTYRIRALRGISRVRALRISPPPEVWLSSTSPVNQTGRVIGFPGTVAFSEPVLLTPDNILPSPHTSPENILTTLGASLAGFHLGDLRADNDLDGNNENNNDYHHAAISHDEAITYQLEYSDDIGVSWKPLQRIYPMAGTMGHGMGDNLVPHTDEIYEGGRNMVLTWCKSDPRTQRFGFHAAAHNLNNLTMRPNTTSYYNAWQYPVDGPGWRVTHPLPVPVEATVFQNDGYTPGDLADNRNNSPSQIADPDGVLRPADGTRATNILAPGSAARPVILNRPFASVGEMGYAMRGDPWKSLDFASAGSADSALLDLFCVTETPAVQAGVINPNKAPQEALESLLAGATIDPTVSTGSLTSANIAGLATSIRARLGATPLVNRAGLAGMTEALTITGPQRDIPTITGLVHKRQRETLVRALADVSNTRTWNLMVDVVAQAGTFPPGSTSADSFIVEGEQRLWTHIALDRPTGKIISQSSEVSSE